MKLDLLLSSLATGAVLAATTLPFTIALSLFGGVVAALLLMLAGSEYAAPIRGAVVAPVPRRREVMPLAA